MLITIHLELLYPVYNYIHIIHKIYTCIYIILYILYCIYYINMVQGCIHITIYEQYWIHTIIIPAYTIFIQRLQEYLLLLLLIIWIIITMLSQSRKFKKEFVLLVSQGRHKKLQQSFQTNFLKPPVKLFEKVVFAVWETQKTGKMFHCLYSCYIWRYKILNFTNILKNFVTLIFASMSEYPQNGFNSYY